MDSNTAALVALKHHEDVEGLFAAGRFDNAAYLAGYVIECGLKTLLLREGMPAAKQLGHDLPLMTGNALSLAVQMAPAIRRYRVPDSADFQHIVAHWGPEERYEATGFMDRAKAESRLRAVRETFTALIVPQLLDGTVRYHP